MQHHGNLVLYHTGTNSSNETVPFATGTETLDSVPVKVLMQRDGRIVLLDGNGAIVWWIGKESEQNPGATLWVLDMDDEELWFGGSWHDGSGRICLRSLSVSNDCIWWLPTVTDDSLSSFNLFYCSNVIASAMFLSMI